jgi:hypothetical protein
MVFSATFKNSLAISWRSALLVQEIEVTGVKHQTMYLLVNKYFYYLLNNDFMVFFAKHYMDRRGHDRMVDGFTTTCAISAYHH